MAYDRVLLDQIKDRLVLSDVISASVKLRKNGKEHMGCCPFHNEKTPSFTVSDQKAFYHCFGCGVHGNIFDFLMHQESLAFHEAVKRAATLAGVTLPQEDRYAPPVDKAQESRDARLWRVLESAALWFAGNIQKPVGANARDYLKNRGCSDTVAATFRLGYAPGSSGALKQYLTGEGFREEEIKTVGLLSQNDQGGTPYDKFRNRLIFPIMDARKRVVGFGGRALEAKQVPKYLNSPETPFFHKREMLYNYAEAMACKKKDAPLLIVEGYMDVIALADHGFQKVVAPLGTAVTEEQIQLAWRIDTDPLLMMDGDNAGAKAQARALDRAMPLLKPNHTLSFISLPQGEDPDSYVRAHGAAALLTFMNRKESAFDKLWALHWDAGAARVPEKMAFLEKNLYQKIEEIPDQKVKFYYQKELKQRLFQAGRMSSYKKKSEDKHRLPLPKLPNFARIQEKILMAIVINFPQILDEFVEEYSHISFDGTLLRMQACILQYIYLEKPLETEALRTYLVGEGLEEELQAIGPRHLKVHATLLFSNPSIDQVQKLWRATYAILEKQALLSEEVAAKQIFKDDFSESAWERYRAMIAEKKSLPTKKS